MRELWRNFRTYCADKHTGWMRYINKIQDCLNLVVHHSTGISPYEWHFGKQPRDKLVELFPMLREIAPQRELQMQLGREKMQRSFDQRVKGKKGVSAIELKVDDLVLLRVPHLADATERVTHKFFHLYQGPFKIMKILNKNAFVLVEPTNEMMIKGTYNRIHLRQNHQRNEGV